MNEIEKGENAVETSSMESAIMHILRENAPVDHYAIAEARLQARLKELEALIVPE